MIDLKRLKYHALAPMEEYFDTYCETEKRYIYIDNDALILGIAHLDYIPNHPHFTKCNLDGLYVFNPFLDDRLGVYLLLEVLPEMVKKPYDILLTIDEETGNSSIKDFKPEKVYKWSFELDRAGLDAVTYGLDNQQFKTAIRDAGIKPSFGTYSDIRDLDGEECRVNFGIGYHLQHTNKCHAKVKDIITATHQIAKFYNANADTPYKRDFIKTYRTYTPTGYYNDRFNWYENYNYTDTCDICYKIINPKYAKKSDGLLLCRQCYNILNDADTKKPAKL